MVPLKGRYEPEMSRSEHKVAVAPLGTCTCPRPRPLQTHEAFLDCSPPGRHLPVHSGWHPSALALTCVIKGWRPWAEYPSVTVRSHDDVTDCIYSLCWASRPQDVCVLQAGRVTPYPLCPFRPPLPLSLLQNPPETYDLCFCY